MGSLLDLDVLSWGGSLLDLDGLAYVGSLLDLAGLAGCERRENQLKGLAVWYFYLMNNFLI